MQFKLDENLPDEAADLLRAAGHDALTVLDQHLGGGPDERLASICVAEGRVLLTLDGGFADIRTYPPPEHAGIIVLRLGNQAKPHVLSVLARIAALLSERSPVRQLWIVDDASIRIRE